MAKAEKLESAPVDAIRDLRNAIEWLKKSGDLIETDKEVDPDLEITGIQKQLDGGCPILFNNVKNKPHHRYITNLFGDMNVINKMFGWKDHADRTRKLAYAITHPIPGQIIDQKDAPVQEEVFEKPSEANEFVVPIRHTSIEPELTVGSGNRLISGQYFDGGTDLGSRPRALPRARGREPEPLALARLRCRLDQFPSLSDARRRLLLQDLHVAGGPVGKAL